MKKIGQGSNWGIALAAALALVGCKTAATNTNDTVADGQHQRVSDEEIKRTIAEFSPNVIGDAVAGIRSLTHVSESNVLAGVFRGMNEAKNSPASSQLKLLYQIIEQDPNAAKLLGPSGRSLSAKEIDSMMGGRTLDAMKKIALLTTYRDLADKLPGAIRAQESAADELVHGSRMNLEGKNKGVTIVGAKKVEGVNGVLATAYDTPERLDVAIESAFSANPEFKELLPEIKEVNRESFLVFHEGAIVPGKTCTDIGPDAMKNVVAQKKKEFAALEEIKQKCDSPVRINRRVAQEHISFQESMGRMDRDAIRAGNVMCKDCFCNTAEAIAFREGMRNGVVREVLEHPSVKMELSAHPCQDN